MKPLFDVNDARNFSSAEVSFTLVCAHRLAYPPRRPNVDRRPAPAGYRGGQQAADQRGRRHLDTAGRQALARRYRRRADDSHRHPDVCRRAVRSTGWSTSPTSNTAADETAGRQDVRYPTSANPTLCERVDPAFPIVRCTTAEPPQIPGVRRSFVEANGVRFPIVPEAGAPDGRPVVVARLSATPLRMAGPAGRPARRPPDHRARSARLRLVRSGSAQVGKEDVATDVLALL